MTARRIIVVDDEAAIGELLREVLTAEGYEVEVASDAGTALGLIRANVYDLAILDFNLPDMDGVMLHRQIRQMDGELAAKTIFMSGLVQSEENASYYGRHSGGFVSKPFDLRDMLTAVRGALGSD